MKNSKPALIAIGTAAALSLSLAAQADPADNPFQIEDLSAGLSLNTGDDPEDDEGKCGEGKCGEGKCGGDDDDDEGKCGEGTCGTA